MDLVGNHGRLLLRLMAASNLRQKVLAGNIANESTPGYVRKVVHFEDLLAREYDGGRGDLTSVEAKVEADLKSPMGVNGNNVNIETENASMRENRLLYEMYASILEARSNMLRASITEGR
jgi:flagellar basal-body rod protein FlgB